MDVECVKTELKSCFGGSIIEKLLNFILKGNGGVAPGELDGRSNQPAQKIREKSHHCNEGKQSNFVLSFGTPDLIDRNVAGTARRKKVNFAGLSEEASSIQLLSSQQLVSQSLEQQILTG